MFDNYEYFEAIVRFGSISKAASYLGISQPGMSGYLKKLENKAGAVLFDRNKNPVVMTPAGQVYYKYLKQINKIKNSYYEETSADNESHVSSITIAGASSTTSSYLPKITAEFTKNNPDVKVTILDGVVMDIAKKAMNEEVDLFLTPQKFSSNEFAYIELFSERLFLCVPKGNPVNEKLDKSCRLTIKDFTSGRVAKETYEGIDLKTFDGIKYILTMKGTSVRDICDTLFNKYDCVPDNPIEVTQMLTGYELSCHSAGITFMPESILRYADIADNTWIYPLDEDITRRSMYLCYKEDKFLSKAVTMYKDMIVERLGK